MKRAPRSFSLSIAMMMLALAAGCGSSSGESVERVGLGAETNLPVRRGTVVVDGCVLEPWARSTLATGGARRILQEVIMLCLVPREDGTVGPRDPSARAALAALASDLKANGYRVHFGVAFTDESGQRYDGAQTRNFLGDAAWRKRFVETLPFAAESADGIEIDLQKLPNDARPFVTALVAETSAVIRPQKRLSIFVPPSVTEPSDLPGGEAFSRAELARYVDRMRIMTLDYSETKPGPTIDPGWAVDAIRLARNATPNVDISFPLYGTDFGPRGPRPTTYFEARAISTISNQPILEGPTGAKFVRYTLFGNESHELWYDDATSTARALGAWSYDVVPADVGVLFYGLGAEDPGLFDRIAERTP
jgi:spore germination protein YaaH